uniref:Uncharacterized protein n=1 Tax=Arundo donax TaxID=35708 RepID=A0A0A9DU74_ARUDO
MLRLRNHLIFAVRAASPFPAAASLRRLLRLSTAAASFVPEDFLVTTCGLTPTQALRASKCLAHLKSSSKPEAVLAFFADIGLAKADVAREPRLLCSKVDKTLSPRTGMLRDIGLRAPDLRPRHHRTPSLLVFNYDRSPLILPFFLGLLREDAHRPQEEHHPPVKRPRGCRQA